MTTETPPAIPDPVIHDWSNDLEDELVDAGMEPPQAKAYRHAFELGMTRVLSVVATKQELLLTKQDLQKAIDDLRGETHDIRDQLRQEMRDLGDQLRREMELRFDAVNTRFAELNARLDRIERRWWAVVGVVIALQAGLYALLGVLLTR